MRRALLALFALALSATSVLAETAPSRLKELATGDAGKGWEAVGRLNLGHGGFCTGALIAADLVLTAAHCLYDQRTGHRIPAGEMEFLAGWRNGRAEAYRGIRKAVAHPAYDYAGREDVDRVAVDLALIQLDRPIRTLRIQPFQTGARLRKGAEVGVVSYAQDRAEAPSLQEVCHVLERQFGVVMLSCSVDFGASGAPIFAFDAAGPMIVSVVSAKAEAKGRPVALASELTRALPTLQRELAAQPDILNRGLSTTAFAPGRNSGAGAKFLKP